MKKIFNLKTLPILINIIIFILLFFVPFFKLGNLTTINNQLSLLTNKVNSAEEMQRELNQKDSLINKIQNDNNQIRTYLVRQYQMQTLKLNEQNEEVIKLNQELKKIGVNLNDLKSKISVSFEKIDSSVTNLDRSDSSEIIFDSLKIYSDYNFKDSSNNLLLNGNINILTGKLSYNYKYKANFDLITYSTNKSVFGKRDLFVKLITNDPSAEITLKSTIIKQPKPSLQIGVGIGGSMFYKNNFKFIPNINISLYKPIIDIYL